MSHAKEMSTSGPSPIEENTYEITLLKEQMAEMMHMMQQPVVAGNRVSYGTFQRAQHPGLKMRLGLHQIQIKAKLYCHSSHKVWT